MFLNLFLLVLPIAYVFTYIVKCLNDHQFANTSTLLFSIKTSEANKVIEHGFGAKVIHDYAPVLGAKMSHQLLFDPLKFLMFFLPVLLIVFLLLFVASKLLKV